ncbi:GNAT family N-acetyltransferase [Aliarcobacter cryaerophilus]|uniref:hypothetical protein n=1 Tax=Aliarcobacter cryaerophilus TaxID=28198 RepID=UPI003DA2D2B1
MTQKAIEIFKNRPKHTNCYVTYNRFLNLINSELFYIIDNNIFILKSENGIFKFLYFVDSLEDIEKSNIFLKNINTPIALEFVTKDIKNIPKFEDFGFIFYKVFSRYSVLKKDRIPPKRKSKDVKLANITDIPEIYKIAQLVFDPLCDFIPKISELEKFVQKNELYIIKKSEILGFALYIKQLYGYDFRINCVAPKYQSKLIGYKLVANLPTDGNKCICWVDDNNLAAIRLNESIGFNKDGLKNYIFIRNNDN